MVMITVSFTAGHGPDVVRVSVTVPAVTSAADGVYTALSVRLSGANAPVPPVQVAPVAEPPKLPFNVTVLPEQIDWSPPAFTVAGGSMVIRTFCEAGAQGPDVVSVSVTAPAVTSAAL